MKYMLVSLLIVLVLSAVFLQVSQFKLLGYIKKNLPGSFLFTKYNMRFNSFEWISYVWGSEDNYDHVVFKRKKHIRFWVMITILMFVLFAGIFLLTFYIIPECLLG
jgi:hypothetical protein